MKKVSIQKAFGSCSFTTPIICLSIALAMLLTISHAAAQTTLGGSITMSKYLGGSSSERLVATINDGNYIYLIGVTASPNFPTTMGQAHAAGDDIFVTKTDLAGNIICSRFVGGSGDDELFESSEVKVLNGEVYFMGFSTDVGYPTVGVASSYADVDPTNTGDIVVTRLDASGNIVFSRYLGGTGDEYPDYAGYTLKAENGFVYIAAQTYSADYPVTDGSSFNHSNNTTAADAVLTKLDAANGAIVYSKYLGTIGEEAGVAMDVENGYVYMDIIASDALGANTFPTTDGTTALTNQHMHAYVKLDPSGNVLYATYKGGSNINGQSGYIVAQNGNLYTLRGTRSADEVVTDGSSLYNTTTSSLIAAKLNAAGQLVYSRYIASTGGVAINNMYVQNGEILFTADASGSGYPVTNGRVNAGNTDYAITRLNTDGSIAFSTLLGSNSANETVTDVVYKNGYYYVLGRTVGGTFPVTNGSIYFASNEYTLTVLNSTGEIVYSTFVGGRGNESQPINNPLSLFVIGNDVYFTGYTNSVDYPTTNGVANGGNDDVVITRISLCPANYNTANDKITPSTQTTCMNGLPQLLTAPALVIPSDSLTTIYRNGVAGSQNQITATNFQWQIGNTINGPFTDIAGATLKNYLPVIANANQFYRRITKTAAFCGGTTIHISDTASVLVSANTAPVAATAGPFNTCSGANGVITIGGVATGGTPGYTYAWDQGVTDTTATVIVNPATTSIFTQTITDANGCKQLGQFVVNVYKADAGPDVGFCAGSAGVMIGTAQIAGFAGAAYSWSPITSLNATNIAQPVSTTAATGTYTLTLTIVKTNNGGGAATCNTTDAVIVTPVAAPTGAFAGADQTICFGSPVTLGIATQAGFAYSWTPGNYLSTGTAAQPVYNAGTLDFTPSPDPATYTVTASKNGCSFTDQVVVNVIRADAGADGCGPIILGGKTDAPNLGETFAWTVLSGTGTFVGGGTTSTLAHPVAKASPAGSPTVYQLVTTLNGQTCTDQVTVSDCGCSFTVVADAAAGCPSTNLGPVKLVASGGDDVNYTYSWSPAAGLSSAVGSTVSLTDNVARTYTVTRTSKIDPSFSCQATKAVNDPAMVIPTFTGLKDTLCPGVTVPIGQASVAGYSYLWATTAGLSSATSSNPDYITGNASKTIAVTVIDGATGCIKNDSAVLIVNPVVVNAGTDWNTCGTGTVELGTAALPNYTYSWSPAATWVGGTSATSAQPQTIVGINLTFTVTATDNTTGCFASDNVDVVVSANPNIPNAPDMTICKDKNVVIGGAARNGLSYSWAPSTNLSNANMAQPTANPTATTTYTLTAIFSNPGCSSNSTDNVTVTVDDPAFTMSPISYCPSSGAVTLSGAPAGMMSYSWSPAGLVSNAAIQTPNTLNPAPSLPTTYSLAVVDANGCTATADLQLNPGITAPNAGSNRTVCQNTATTIGDATNSTTGFTYAWTGTNITAGVLSSTTSINPAFTASAGTGVFKYQLAKTQTSDGCVSKDSVILTVINFTMSPAPAAQTICSGASVNIGVTAQSGASYVWSPATALSATNIANPVCTATSSTIYKMTAIGANGCQDSAFVPVTVNAGPNPVITMADQTICLGSATTTQFSPSFTVSTPTLFSWTPDNGTVSNLNIANPTIYLGGVATKAYTLVATNAAGCAATKTNNIIVQLCPVKMTGNVFNDANGLTDARVNGTGTNPGSSLFVHLLDANGALVATVPVNGDGTYTFEDVDPGTYSVSLNANAIGTSQSLPTTYVNTGEFLGNPLTNGNDGLVNSMQNAIVVATADIANINFGIEQQPVPVIQNYTISAPASGSFIPLNGTGTGSGSSPGPLRGSDAEDLPATGSLIGQTIAITSLPAHGELWYNGAQITATGNIANYDPALLQIKFTAGGYNAITFGYNFIDAAGIAGTPATYTVNFITPLPLNLLSFTATNGNNQTALLNWQTAQEQNSSFFEVQHSTDAVSWELLGNIAAAGNSKMQHNYQYVHDKPAKGANYYRLKMVDVNGAAKYSIVRTVNVSANGVVTVLPNPVTDKVFVTGRNTTIKMLQLFDATGMMVWHSESFANGGSIDMSAYAPGTYLLTISTNDVQETHQLIKK